MDADTEARFQNFINSPGSDAARLRDAFAQLMAQGAETGSRPLTIEQLMAVQGQQQMPPPVNAEIRNFATEAGPEGLRTPTRTFEPDPRLNFPTAGNTLDSDEFKPPGGKTDADQAPFHGKGSYVLPKEMRKKGKR